MPSLAEYIEPGGYPATGMEHEAYRASMLWRTAPEYATPEVLVGGAYRELVVDQTDAAIELGDIPKIPGLLGLDDIERTLWEQLVSQPDGLASPAPAGRKNRTGQVQAHLMPIVPEIARHANVLGSKRSRWNSGALVSSTIAAGIGPVAWTSYTAELAAALKVGPEDDLLARYLDGTLGRIASAGVATPPSMPPAPWRTGGGRPTPAERFVDDLARVQALKPVLTRRQWTILVETSLRFGLGLHLMWLMRLNWNLWAYLLGIVDGEAPDRGRLDAIWELHRIDAILEIGADAGPPIRRTIQKFVEARLGLNVLLHALDAAGAGWPTKLGTAGKDTREELHDFAQHVSRNRAAVTSAVDSDCGMSLRQAVGKGIDSRPGLVGLTSGFSNNIREYLRYSLGRLNPNDPNFRSYDQGYLLVSSGVPRGMGRVELGPTALIYLALVSSRDGAGNVSLDRFRDHLLGYGIHVPAGELTTGQTIRSLERLGLTIESPDAGGGRMLVSPFLRGAAGA